MGLPDFWFNTTTSQWTFNEVMEHSKARKKMTRKVFIQSSIIEGVNVGKNKTFQRYWKTIWEFWIRHWQNLIAETWWQWRSVLEYYETEWMKFGFDSLHFWYMDILRLTVQFQKREGNLGWSCNQLNQRFFFPWWKKD